jgi:hypothetical protein
MDSGAKYAALCRSGQAVIEAAKYMTGHAWDCDLTTWRRVDDMTGPAPVCTCGLRDLLSALAAHAKNEQGTGEGV